jgi:DNA-binding LytR/AlgR family response regulator
LPFDKRGALISLHAEDHYVRIETVKGSELILMRLADAIQLAQPAKGVQVHRSHWVALDQVTGYDKTDGTWNVILSNGRRVPISRGYRADAITAGIIPARG